MRCDFYFVDGNRVTVPSMDHDASIVAGDLYDRVVDNRLNADLAVQRFQRATFQRFVDRIVRDIQAATGNSHYLGIAHFEFGADIEEHSAGRRATRLTVRQ